MGDQEDRPHRMHGRSQELWDALKSAGLVREGDYVRRVIIDINADAAVVVHIERYADTRTLEILPVLGRGAEIRWSPEQKPEQEEVVGPCGYLLFIRGL